MELFDTHAHLWDVRYDVDAETVIKDFFEDNKNNIMVAVGTNANDCKRLTEIDHPRVFKAMGVHPQFASSYDEGVFDLIRENKNNIVAIGEIGLDYYYGKDDKDKQLDLLEKQFALAEELGKPVILHCREAGGDLLEVIDKYPNVRGVVHCFSEDYKTAKALIERGYYLGVGGSYTFKNNGELRKIVQTLGLSGLVLETDSPYLAPVPMRGKANRPQFVRYTARAIAEDFDLSEEDVLKITTQNAYKLFGLE